jgi:hypothetical protein
LVSTRNDAGEPTDHQEGEEVELPLNVALELKQDLEPLDEEGAFPDPAARVGLQGQVLARHEELDALNRHKASLESQLSQVSAQIERKQALLAQESQEQRTGDIVVDGNRQPARGEGVRVDSRPAPGSTAPQPKIVDTGRPDAPRGVDKV